MEKEVSQQSLTPTLPTLPDTPVAQHQDAFGYKAHDKGHLVTYGEKKFDRLTYTTVGYVINALLSVGAVWWAERTHGGQKSMDNFRNWSERNLKFVKPETAKMLATKSFFLSGGFAVLAPMKWMEDKKVEMVKKWDAEHYGDAGKTDERIQQSHKDLENAPKQGWGSIFASRALALVPFYVGYGMIWDKTSPLSKHTDEKIFIDKPIVAASRGIGKGWAKLTGNKVAEETITSLNKSHVGEILNPKEAAKAGLKADPTHSVLPYYMISEAITSGMVAWGVYALTRVLAPIMGKKAPLSPAEKKKEAERTVEIHTNANSEVQKETAAPQPKKEDRPETSLQLDAVHHEKMNTVQHAAQASL